MTLRLGDMLDGRYRIASIVRERSASSVFDGVDTTTGARVAIQLLTRTRSSGDESYEHAAQAFLAGARCARGLRSPHLARVLEAGVTAAGAPWLVREHLASTPLSELLRMRAAFSVRDAVDVALAVCEAIAVGHSNGLFHGALGAHAVHVLHSPEGVVDVKVTGIGTAAAENVLSLGAPGDVECVLRAPEYLRYGAPVDARVDVWSIGVLLHTLLAGRAPFKTDTPSGASLSVVLDEPPRLDRVPAALADAVLDALVKNPSLRTRNVLVFADAIAPFGSNREDSRERLEGLREALESALPSVGNTLAFRDLTFDVEKVDPTSEGGLTTKERAAGGFCLTSDERPAVRRPRKQVAPPPLNATSDSSFASATFAQPHFPSPVATVRIAPLSRTAPTCQIPRVVDEPRKRRGVSVLAFLALVTVAASITLALLFGVARLKRLRSACPPAATLDLAGRVANVAKCSIGMDGRANSRT